MNDLVTAPLVGDGAEAAALVESARAELTAAVKRARSKAADVYKPFHGVLGRAEKLASEIGELFDGLRIPVFPPPDRLLAFADYIDHDAYHALAGVERFALMNIGARLQSITLGPGEGGGTLADPRFEHPDLRGVPGPGVLHGEGRVSARGRGPGRAEDVRAGAGGAAPLPRRQLQAAPGPQGQPPGQLRGRHADRIASDATRICVDADIDLYRGTVAHLFGEVLVNHLTGSKTDQFKVWDTLAGSAVTPIGGFDVIAV